MRNVVVALVLAVLSIGIWEAETSRPLSEIEKQKINASCKYETHKDSSVKDFSGSYGASRRALIKAYCFVRGDHQAIGAAATILIGFFTLGLWIATLQLRKITQRQADHLQRIERA